MSKKKQRAQVSREKRLVLEIKVGQGWRLAARGTFSIILFAILISVLGGFAALVLKVALFN